MHRAPKSPSAAASLRDGGGGGTVTAPRSRHRVEGPLRKYTNLLHGWQSRFFVLDPDSGQLWYYLSAATRGQQAPRGALCVEGAIVWSSPDHPFMFTVQSSAGEVYKLRARDAQEQELWMTQLQLCSRHNQELSPGEKRPQTLEPHPRQGPLSGDEDLFFFKTPSSLSCLGQCLSLFHQNLHRTPSHNHVQSPSLEPISPPDRAPSLAQPTPSVPLNHMEPGGLVQANHSPPHKPGSVLSYHQNQALIRADTPDSSQPLSEKQQRNSTAPPVSNSRTSRAPAQSTEDVSDEATDTEDNAEEELGVLDEQRNIMIHLLSQLKMGMDLTRVVLPTFILEKRSLLEMYANFLSHPDMFLSITSGRSPEERMIRVLEYYLTSFHEGRKGAVAKKPYNPILGETFHCSWTVPRVRRPASAPGQSVGGSGFAA
ncbi:hypothetical protein NQD34_012413 [Periophthalmus magnuspinnatus]|nr:hypothetical protein NQD34_012413 [Periophthalmus magnuspinnatus]